MISLPANLALCLAEFFSSIPGQFWRLQEW